jgi:hypothetical protein
MAATHSLSFTRKVAGRAGLTRTQRRIQRDTERPAWIWRLTAERPCWRNHHIVTVTIPRATITDNGDGTFNWTATSAFELTWGEA